MKKMSIVLILILFLALFSAFLMVRNDYFLRISINFDNYSAKEIDRIFAEDIKDKLVQIPQVKEVVIFSRNFKCSVYVKLSPFVFDRRKIAYIIENRLNQVTNNIDNKIEIDFDDEFYIRYPVFLVIDTGMDYFSLKRNCDEIFDRILDLNITKKILNLECFKKATYVYYSNDKLVQYNLNLDDIKNIIANNNIFSTSCHKTTSKNLYLIDTDSDYKSIDDIKKTAVFYPDKNFSIQFGDIFKVKNEIKKPQEYSINFNHKKAHLMALSKKNIVPQFFFNFKIRETIKKLKKDFPEMNFKLLYGCNMVKIEVYFDNTISFEELFLQYKKIDNKLSEKKINNVLFFLGIDCPKISLGDDFFEAQKNKITILSPFFKAKNIEKILDESGFNYVTRTNKKIVIKNKNPQKLYENIKKYYPDSFNRGTDKAMGIKYSFNEFSLNDFLMSKKEVLNSIMANNDGFFAIDYFDSENDRVSVFIKNENPQNRNYIFSKNYKTLIYLPLFYKESLENEFCVLSRKNDDYFSEIIIKK